MLFRSENQVAGTLPYITGWTEFSGDETEQNGNYLGLHFTYPDDATTTVKKNDSETASTLDSDHVCIFRITPNTKTITVNVTRSGESLTKVLNLDGVVRKPAA